MTAEAGCDAGTGAPGPDGPADAAMAQAIADTQDQLAVMMVHARRSLKSRAVAIHPALQPMAFKVLMLLSRSGPTRQSELGRMLEMDKALVSRTIKQLEIMDLVVRSEDPHDGRAMLVDMTGLAHERYTAALLDARQELITRLSVWDVAEVRRLAELLSRLNESDY